MANIELLEMRGTVAELLPYALRRGRPETAHAILSRSVLGRSSR